MRIGIMQRKMQKGSRALPPRAQLQVLFLINQGDAQTVKDIAQQFGMTSSAATQLVNGLVKSNLLQRKEDEDDRRKICLQLTAEGKKMLLQAKQHRLQKMKILLDPLSDREVVHILRLQEKIIDHWQTVCSNR